MLTFRFLFRAEVWITALLLLGRVSFKLRNVIKEFVSEPCKMAIHYIVKATFLP